jgi:hypothetical protein
MKHGLDSAACGEPVESPHMAGGSNLVAALLLLSFSTFYKRLLSLLVL